MRAHSFTYWLHESVTAARCALLTAYEERDRLTYIEGPRIERDYMEKVGSFEETVIKEELECEILREKQKIIQAAINRREVIDEAAIDAQLEEYRKELLKEAEGNSKLDLPLLTSEENKKLQELYHEIVVNFHPEMHPELTDVHRQLFQKAQEAYRHRDIEALKLISEMLFSTEDGGIGLEIMIDLLSGAGEVVELRNERDYSTDYSLASEIYNCFKVTTEDAVIQEERVRYRQKTDEVLEAIEQMRAGFPFSAAAMLADPERVEAYKERLAHRLRTATEEREKRTQVIRKMIESVAVHE